MRRFRKRILSVSLAGVALLVTLGVARAAILDLAVYQAAYQYPDVTTGTILVEYDEDGVNATTGTFSATSSGWGDMYTAAGPPTHYVDFDPPFGGSATTYELNITLDHSGNLAGPQAADSFMMWDDVWDDSFVQVVNNPGVPFLQGRVSAFGWAPNGQFFDFIVTELSGDGVDGGWFAHTYDYIGINMPTGGPTTGWSGSFDADFVNNGGGNSDVFNIPEPAAGALALFGLAGVCGVAFRKFSWRCRL